MTDPEEATSTVHGEPTTTTTTTTTTTAGAGAGVVVDVQTHFLESGQWGGGFPQAACGEPDPIDCFAAEYWRDLVFAASDTAVVDHV